MGNHSLKNILGDTGEKLSENGSDSLPALRKLQKTFSSMQAENDKNLRFVVYFLNGIIDDICFNVTGDFPSKKVTNEIINAFFKEFGGYLTLLRDNLEVEELSIFEPLVEMVNCYLNMLEKVADAF